MNQQEKDYMLYMDAIQYLKDSTVGLTDEILDCYLQCNEVSSLDWAFTVAVRCIPDIYKPKRKRFEQDSNYMDKIHRILSRHNDGFQEETPLELEYVLEKYVGNDYENQAAFEDALLNHLSFDDKMDTFTKKVVGIYANIVCGIAQYLSEFSDSCDMFNHFSRFDDTKRNSMKCKLVKEIQNASHGSYKIRESWGFALAANWLKDIGMDDYCKPDKFIKEFCTKMSLCKSNGEVSVFNGLRAAAHNANLIDADINAFKYDRIIWLIGSRDFYKHRDIVSFKENTGLDQFIEQELEKLH